MLEACVKSLNISPTCWKHFRSMLETCAKHFQVISDACWMHFESMFETFPKLRCIVGNFSKHLKACSKQFQNILDACWKHMKAFWKRFRNIFKARRSAHVDQTIVGRREHCTEQRKNERWRAKVEHRTSYETTQGRTSNVAQKKTTLGAKRRTAGRQDVLRIYCNSNVLLLSVYAYEWGKLFFGCKKHVFSPKNVTRGGHRGTLWDRSRPLEAHDPPEPRWGNGKQIFLCPRVHSWPFGCGPNDKN